MFFESFKITGLAVAQIFIIGAIGYVLVKKNVFGSVGLDSVSRLTIDVTLPMLIFCQLVERFSFTLLPDWWIFPLLSIGITLAGLGLGEMLSVFIIGDQPKAQFKSLVAFQNSGYLPLALIASLFPGEQGAMMLVCLFLFLAGFNLAMFSLGPHMLSHARDKKLELRSLFSPPVVAVLLSLAVVFFGGNRFIPEFALKPLRVIGDCTLPLAMLVVGGSLAQIRLEGVDARVMFLLVAAKLIILPAAGLFLIIALRLPEVIGFLILIQLAMPSATSLTAIIRHYKQQDLLISQGIFVTHMASLVAIPVFLSLYLMFGMIK